MYDRSFFFVTFAALLLASNSQYAPGCVWDLNVDLPKNDPLYMVPNTAATLIVPTSTGLNLALGQEMTLVCPGKINVINGTTKQELTLSCTSNNSLLYNGQAVRLNTFECAASTLSELIVTMSLCAGGRGTTMISGFLSSMGFVPLINTCYDRLNEASFYSINTLYGNAIANAERESDRPSFRTPGLTFGTTSANQYKQTEQLKRFTTLLGASQANKYLNTSSFLARGHLSPDADFLFGSWSTASYFFVNAAPEWQVVNAGNWLRVENMARDIASQRNENLTVYTGTHGVSQLPNDYGQSVNLYLLPDNKLPVPKWYWKIIYSSSTSEGIALISLNNPHVDAVGPLLCTDVCSQYGWVRPEWTVYRQGYTYCCEVNSLIAALGTLNAMNVVGVMQGPV